MGISTFKDFLGKSLGLFSRTLTLSQSVDMSEILLYYKIQGVYGFQIEYLIIFCIHLPVSVMHGW